MFIVKKKRIRHSEGKTKKVEINFSLLQKDNPLIAFRQLFFQYCKHTFMKRESYSICYFTLPFTNNISWIYLCSEIWIDLIVLHGCIVAFHICIYHVYITDLLVLDIWVISNFSLLQLVHQRTSLYVFLCISIS